MHPPSSTKKAAPTETRTHNIYGRWVVLKKSKNPGGWKEAKSKKYQPHGDFRLKIQTRFQSRHPVNTYSRNGIYTYTHIQNVLHWRVNHGWSSLVVLRLHREQRPLARFRMECVFFFFCFIFSSFFFYPPRELFQCVSRDSLVIDDAFAPRAPHATASIKQRLSEEQRRCTATVSLSFDML